MIKHDRYYDIDPYFQLPFMTYMTDYVPQFDVDVSAYPYINLLRAKCIRGSINIYLHYVWFLHIDMTQVVEMFPV